MVDDSMNEIDSFNEKKKLRIEKLNKNYPNGFPRQVAVFLHLDPFKTIIDKNGKCIDLVPCKWSETFIPSCTVSEDKKRITCDSTGFTYTILD